MWPDLLTKLNTGGSSAADGPTSMTWFVGVVYVHNQGLE